MSDYWNVDGEKELSDAWTGFTRFVLLKERPPEGYTWSGWRLLTRKQKTSRPDGQTCGNLCPMQRKRKQNKDGLSRNQSSTMPDNREEYSLLNQTMKNSSSQRKPLGESWKFRCQPAAKPCEIPIKSSGETHRNIGKRKTKYSSVVDSDESRRPKLEGAGHKPHQDHITAKGTNSLTHYSLVHKIIPMPQALK